MCDVEGMALMLSTVTKTFGELKGLSAAIFTPSHHQGRSLFKLLLHLFFFHYEIKKPLKIRNEIFHRFSLLRKKEFIKKTFLEGTFIWSSYLLTLEFLVLLVAGFPDMQKDLKQVMAGEMEVVVNEEKSVLVLFLCSQVTRHLLDYLFLCSTILEYFASFLFCLHLVAFGEI